MRRPVLASVSLALSLWAVGMPATAQSPSPTPPATPGALALAAVRAVDPRFGDIDDFSRAQQRVSREFDWAPVVAGSWIRLVPTYGSDMDLHPSLQLPDWVAPRVRVVEVMLVADCAELADNGFPDDDPCGWRHQWLYRVLPTGEVVLLYDQGSQGDSAPPRPSPAVMGTGTLADVLPATMSVADGSTDGLPIIWNGGLPGGPGLGRVPFLSIEGSGYLGNVLPRLDEDGADILGDRGLAGDGTNGYRVLAVTDPSGDARRMVAQARRGHGNGYAWHTSDIDGRTVTVLDDGGTYLYAAGPWAFEVSSILGDDTAPMDAFIAQLPGPAAPASVPPQEATDLGVTLAAADLPDGLRWIGSEPDRGQPITPYPLADLVRLNRVIAASAAQLGVDTSALYSFLARPGLNSPTSATVLVLVDPTGDGDRWVAPMRAGLAAANDDGSPSAPDDLGDMTVGGRTVAHLVDPDSLEVLRDISLYAAGPAFFMVVAESAETAASVRAALP